MHSTRPPERVGEICARLLEEEIIFQGPDTVAAFIAEPVMGAGGVIVPPANSWPLVREVCDRYGVLLIADESLPALAEVQVNEIVDAMDRALAFLS